MTTCSNLLLLLKHHGLTNLCVNEMRHETTISFNGKHRIQFKPKQYPLDISEIEGEIMLWKQQHATENAHGVINIVNSRREESGRN